MLAAHLCSTSQLSGACDDCIDLRHSELVDEISDLREQLRQARIRNERLEARLCNHDWSALDLLKGRTEIPANDGEPGYALEYGNCKACHTTLCREVAL